MPPIQIRKCYSPDDLCCNFFPLFTENLSSVTGAPKSGDMIQKERKGWGRLSTQPGSEATLEPGPWTREGAGAGELLQGQPWAFTGGLAHQQARPRGLCTVTPPRQDTGFQDHCAAGWSSFPATSTGEAGHPDPCSSKGLRAAPRGLGQPLCHRGV